MATNLNSACNCCAEVLEVPAIFSIFICALEYKSKNKSLGRCGFQNPEDGKIYSRTVRTQSDPFGGAKIDVVTQEETEWDGSAIQSISESEFSISSPDTGYCVGSVSGFVSEDTVDFDETEYFNEYTNEILLSNFELIPFSEFGEFILLAEPAAASKSFVPLATAANSTLVQSIVEARITHKPSISGYLKVWFWLLREEVLEDDIIWTYEQAGSYEWSGPVPNTNSISSDENIIYGEPIEVISTELNEGSTVVIRKSLVIAKFSFLQGYEPSDPIFNTENGTFARVENDCESDGFPRTIIGGGNARPEFITISDNPNCEINA
jgi:hypothetical protein